MILDIDFNDLVDNASDPQLFWRITLELVLNTVFNEHIKFLRKWYDCLIENNVSSLLFCKNY